MKRILVDDRCLHAPGAGVAVYIRNLLGGWPAEARVRPVGFLARLLGIPVTQCRRRHDPCRPVSLRALGAFVAANDRRRPWPVLWRLSSRLYETSFRLEFQRGKYDASFQPNHLALPTCRGPIVATVHDLSPLEHPEWHPPDRVLRWRSSLEAGIRITDRWIAVSSFTRSRMVELLGLAPERIRVIPLAARALPYPTEGQYVEVRRAAGLPDRYLLHLGTMEPRKNLTRLLDAYGRLPQAVRASCPLILAGMVGWGEPDFWKGLAGHPRSADVFCTGWVDDDQAAVLLACAQAFLVPSFYEGFGLPLVEAMACGTPVVCSTAQAFREVAGTAAEIIGPQDTAAWTEAMRRAFEDPAWRARLGDAGRARAKRFSWERTIREHVDLFESILQ